MANKIKTLRNILFETMITSHCFSYSFTIIFILSGIGNFCFGNGDPVVIKILKETQYTVNNDTFSLHSGEIYVSQISSNRRTIRYYQQNVFYIPFKSFKVKEINYEIKEALSTDQYHFVGEWPTNMCRRVIEGVDYYHIDASWFPEIDSAQIKIYNFYGDPIITLDRITKQTDFNKSLLKSNDIIRVVVPGQLTQLFKIPEDELIPIDKNYYEEIKGEHDNTFFGKKKQDIFTNMLNREIL